MQDDPRMRQYGATPGRTGGEQDRAGSDRLADAGGRDRRPDELHGVVDREHGGHVTALAVDVEVDLLIRLVRLEVEKLRDQRVRDTRVDRRTEVDDALAEQVRVDVHDAFAARMLSDDIRDGVGAHQAAFRWGITWSKDSTTWSMKPYSRACSAVYQWSCSESSCTVSNGWPVSSAMSASTVSRMCRRSLAWISISTADPPIPAEPWCIRTRACRRAYRLPGVPADSRNCPALHASPIASVDTSHGTSRITSRIASIDGTDPPSEW